MTRLDSAFNLMDDVHTNVIAGLAMDDGETIAAWLPEAEVEFGPPDIAPLAPVRSACAEGRRAASRIGASVFSMFLTSRLLGRKENVSPQSTSGSMRLQDSRSFVS